MITVENAKNVLESFTGTVVSDLHTWIDHEIDELRKQYDNAKDFVEVRAIQGKIEALNKLKLIRDYAAQIVQKKV